MQNHLSGVNLGYRLPDGSLLFDSITFSFSAVRTGLVGVNGVGKTILLEILVGRAEPSTGSLVRCGRLSYLSQTVRLDLSAGISEVLNLSDALAAYHRTTAGEGRLEDFDLLADRWDLPERIQQTFAELGISHLALDRRISSLSGGELTRVRLAGLLLEEPDFLVLDEPTNHLDLSARDFIYEFIANWKKGLLVVSHDRRLLSLLDQIAELNPKGMKLYGGNYEFYREQREAERLAAEQALGGAQQRLKQASAVAQQVWERQQKRQSAAAKKVFNKSMPTIVAGNLRRLAENSAAQLKNRHQQKVEDARRKVAEVRSLLPVENRITVDLANSVVPAQKRMVELKEVNYRYPDAEQPLWTTPLSFEITGPQRIWLKGANGVGKSTLIDLLCSRKTPSSGAIKLGSNRIGLLDQKVTALDDSLTVLENLKSVASLRPEHELRTLLGRFLFIRDDALKSAGVLSGGERMRAGLACLLGRDQSPEILILDEPTNNLDLASVEALISALNHYCGVLIVVSHDLVFLREVKADRVVEL